MNRRNDDDHRHWVVYDLEAHGFRVYYNGLRQEALFKSRKGAERHLRGLLSGAVKPPPLGVPAAG